MNWKDYRISCDWCKSVIEMEKWQEEPDIDYYGKKWIHTSKFWHFHCIMEYIKVKNVQIGIYD